jgi:anti-sigma regulatory factor (Ser/Thr protein kinase)
VQDRRTHPQERQFPPDARSVRAARQFVQLALADDDDLATRAALIVSELAGNAVVHASSSYTVRIAVGAAVVRGEVVDGDRRLPMPRRANKIPSSDGHGGRGLVIVDAMADRWGARPEEHGGKVVWFELDVPDGHGTPTAGLPEPETG